MYDISVLYHYAKAETATVNSCIRSLNRNDVLSPMSENRHRFCCCPVARRETHYLIYNNDNNSNSNSNSNNSNSNAVARRRRPPRRKIAVVAGENSDRFGRKPPPFGINAASIGCGDDAGAASSAVISRHSGVLGTPTPGIKEIEIETEK